MVTVARLGLDMNDLVCGSQRDAERECSQVAIATIYQLYFRNMEVRKFEICFPVANSDVSETP